MSKIALCEASGLLSNLLSNLAGKNGDEWAEILRRTLRRQNPFQFPVQKFEPTYTITLHNRENADVLEEIEKRFGQLDRFTREYFDKRDWFHACEGRQDDIVILSGRQLGFENVVKLRHVYVRGEELGLRLCFDCMPVWALLQQSDKFRGKFVAFAMEPHNGYILGVGEPNFVSYGRGGTTVSKIEMGLHLVNGRISSDFSPDSLWAFQIS